MSTEEKNKKEKEKSKDEAVQVFSNQESNDKAHFNQQMKQEKERLASFKNWPLSFILPQELAKYGFYYMGQKDKVKCAFCKIVILEWAEGDSPFTEHRKYFPNCPFLSGFDVGNVPINENPIKPADHKKGVDVCGHFIFPLVNNNDKDCLNKPHDSSILNGILQNVESCCGPQNINFVTLDSRLKSFENWPKESPVKPEKLAEAGFFSIGKEDYVKCFFCDGGLRDWQKEDEPWTEHEKWFPNCDFIRLMKTEKILENVASSPKLLKVKEDEKNSENFEASKTETLKNENLNQEVPKITENSDDKNSGFTYPQNDDTSVNSHSDDDSAIASGTSSPHKVSPSSSPASISKPSDSIGLVCKICLDLDVNVVFIPCMHAISCVQCALVLTNCPICRNVIHERKRLYFS